MTVTIRDKDGKTVNSWVGVEDVQFIPGPIPVLLFISPLKRMLGVQALGEGYAAEYGAVQ